jgi:hypothetical protein
MLGWLKTKMQNSRVFVCVKDIKFVLENADQKRRAVILALASWFRMTTLADEHNALQGLDRPLDYGRDELMRFYGILEDIRNLSIVQFEALKRNVPKDAAAMRRNADSIGLRFEGPSELPQFAIDHAKNAQRGLEIWMCTLGAGIVPKCRDDVRLIWSYLVGSMSSLPVAIQELRSIERRTTEMTGQASTEMFGNITTEQWMEFCRYVPSSFANSLRGSGPGRERDRL